MDVFYKPMPRHLVELVPGMVTLFNVKTSKYTYVNKAIYKVLGYKPHDLIEGGSEFTHSIVHPDDLQFVLEKDSEALRQADRDKIYRTGSDPISSLEFRMRHKKGHYVWMHTDCIVYDRDEEGRLDHVLYIANDISERIESERKLRQRTEDLVDINKSKDEFVAIASHQLRTPATAVKQYLGLLLEGYAEPLLPDQRSFLEKAFESNERQLHIVDDMLRVAQLDLEKMNLRPVRTDIGGLVKDAAAALQGRLKTRRQTLKLSLPKTSAQAKVDPERLQMVIENLLENASNYSASGKEIELKLRHTAKKIEISVCDAGVGINRDDYPKLFQKFSRIANTRTNSVSGTGLGLYFSAKIVELHGGRIKVESAPGKGSTFTIMLPI